MATMVKVGVLPLATPLRPRCHLRLHSPERERPESGSGTVGEIVGIGRKAKMEEFYAFVGRLDDYKEGLVIGMCFLLIVAHSRLKTRDWGFIVMSVVFVVLSASAFIAELFLADPTVFFWQFVTLLVAYGTGVYIFMCDVPRGAD
jgi:hypothetical protein